MAAATLLLDLDGTLWHSRPWFAETIARQSGSCSSDIESLLQAGANIVRVAKDYGVSRTRLVQAASATAGSLELYEQVLHTLDILRERGTPIGIVSNLPGWLVRPLIESKGMDMYFAATVTPRPGVPAKPSPNGIRRALQQMDRLADARTWFVGDGTVDARAAIAADVKFAWASYGYEKEQPLGTAKTLERFEDVLRL